MDMGHSAQAGSTLLVIVGISNTIGRVGGGRLADQLGVVRTFGFSMVMTGTATLLLPLSGAYFVLATYAVIFGFFGGAFMGLMSVVLAELYGIANLPRSMGLGMTAWAIGGFFGSPTSGIKDQRNLEGAS